MFEYCKNCIVYADTMVITEKAVKKLEEVL